MHPLRSLVRLAGFDIVRWQAKPWPVQDAVAESCPRDSSDQEAQILQFVSGFTLTSPERQMAVIDAVRYIVKRKLPGSIVECGVWRGGSSMIAALTLMQEQELNREIYLLDTFAGMTPPSDVDVDRDGISAEKHLDSGNEGVWCIAGLEDVKQNMESTNYPLDKVHFVEGPVEKTVTESFPPGPIALLRLDTDWYESTRHELVHLFPRLVDGGVLIMDDYGHWQGARKAVDEYLLENNLHFFMHKLDYTGRLLIKF